MDKLIRAIKCIYNEGGAADTVMLFNNVVASILIEKGEIVVRFSEYGVDDHLTTPKEFGENVKFFREIP